MIYSNCKNKSILIITIIIINLITILCNICQNVCKTSKNCLELCEKDLNDPKRNAINLPHCGLTQLNGNTNARIVNGKLAKEKGYPWMVSFHYDQDPNSVEDQKDLHFCGGAIINEYFILTAAHCL